MEEFHEWLASGGDGVERSLPACEMIPAAERRRMPKTAKLALQAAQDACAAAGTDPSSIASVFSSIIADTETTDQICSALAKPNKFLSPTKFHNSVQNAAAGYWAIGTQNHEPCSYVAGGLSSFAAALMELGTQCLTEQRKGLLVSYEMGGKTPFTDILSQEEDFACALVLEPAANSGPVINMKLVAGSPPPEVASNNELQNYINKNPGAAGLELFAAMATGGSCGWPVSATSWLEVSCSDA